jgi:hypothetical protein
MVSAIVFYYFDFELVFANGTSKLVHRYAATVGLYPVGMTFWWA